MSFTLSHLCSEFASFNSEQGAKSTSAAKRTNSSNVSTLIHSNLSKWIRFLFYSLIKNNNSGALAAFASEQHLTSLKNAMEQEEKKEMQTKWEAQGPAHISSLLTGLRVTPGILVKVYVEVSVRVPFKRMKEIG